MNISTANIADKQFGKVLGLFTMLAPVIAGLGCIASQSSWSQRTKELSLRRILGAGTE
jgi:hypothetical protein